MKRIPLTQGRFAIVDDEDYEFLMQWKWQAGKSRNTFYARRTVGKIKCAVIYMHRVIMKAHKGQEIDHVDGNGLANVKSNLRFCNRSQNAQNKRPHKYASSKYKGVSRSNRTAKWKAQIMYNYRNHSLGYFDDDIEAAKAYDAKARELFGEFAHTNFWT